MLKTFFITCVLIACLYFGARAQATHRDSVARIAKADAKKFSLSSADLKKLRAHRHKTSDYFKPSPSTTADAALLRDSDYVHTFRRVAYHHTRGKRTVAHGVIIGVGSAFVAFCLLVALVPAAFLPGKTE